MKTIVIDVSPAGSVTIDAKCFTGKDCAKATEQIELVIGGAGQKTKTPKPEFFAPTNTQANNKLTF